MSIQTNMQDRFESLINRIETAIEDVDSGKSVDLGAMDREVAEACHTIERSDAQTAHALKPVMGRMITKLDELADSLKRHQDFLKNGT